MVDKSPHTLGKVLIICKIDKRSLVITTLRHNKTRIIDSVILQLGVFFLPLHYQVKVHRDLDVVLVLLVVVQETTLIIPSCLKVIDENHLPLMINYQLVYQALKLVSHSFGQVSIQLSDNGELIVHFIPLVGNQVNNVLGEVIGPKFLHDCLSILQLLELYDSLTMALPELAIIHLGIRTRELFLDLLQALPFKSYSFSCAPVKFDVVVRLFQHHFYFFGYLTVGIEIRQGHS